MRSDFCALILTHGRPDVITTVEALERFGYTGPIYLVVDDEDATLPAYQAKFGADKVVTFSKRDIAQRFDECDNFNDRRTIFYARNASFEIARSLGFRYFIQLDDDYFWFHYRFDGAGRYCTVDLHSLDWLFERLVEYLAATPFLSVAISQGGDWIGGGDGKSVIGAKRKAMNSFVCDVERTFEFLGRINEDVNTYTSTQRRGGAFLTFMAPQLVQTVTQVNEGGMSAAYASFGTYVKSFYSVMLCPSAMKIGTIESHGKGEARKRIHHFTNWNAVAPCILSEEHRKL